jgi:hypothetical protein
MSDKALPVGWAIKVMTKPPGGGREVEIFDVTYPDRAAAQEAVKRHLGSGGDYEVVAVDELVATDLGPNKVRVR